MKRNGLAFVLFFLLALLAVTVLAGCGCGGDDDDDNDTGDDTDDDVDDDVDDDTDDDVDDDTDVEWPEGYTVDPADEETEVGLSRRVVIHSSLTPMDREALGMRLLDGETEVAGTGYFSRALDPFEGDSYFFFPGALLETGKTYTVEFTVEGNVYRTTFQTVGETGDIFLYGNAEVNDNPDLDPYAFRLTFPTVLDPGGGWAILLQPLLSAFNFLGAPAIIDSADGKTGTMTFAIGAGEEFDGDPDLEQDYTLTGYVLDGDLAGPYFKRTGPFSLVFGDVTLDLDLFDVSVEFAEGKGGKQTPLASTVAAYIADCQPLKDLLPEEFQGLVDEVCDQNTLFLHLELGLANNPLDDLAFAVPFVGNRYIWYTFLPGVWAEEEEGSLWISNFSTILRFFQDGELVHTSLEYPDGLSYYLKAGAVEGGRFTQVRYDYPPTLAAGTYDVDFHLGMYCYRRTGVVVGE